MIACFAIPYFAAAVERRDDGALTAASLVIGGQPWEPQPVYAFSRGPARRGVRPGMPLRLAQVLSPQAHFLPATPTRYSHAAAETGDVLADFTPLVEPEEWWRPPDKKTLRGADGRSLPTRYTVDFEDLPVDEAVPLARHIGRTLREQTQLSPAVGVAAHPFAARVAASLTRPDHARPVQPGEEAAFLAERSIHFLPLPVDVRRRLKLLGIATLGQLAALPVTALQTQFGPEMVVWHRLAGGEASPPVRPLPEEQVVTAGRHFEAPLDNWVTLTAVLEQMAAELAEQLAAEGLAAGQVVLAWEEERGPAGEQAVRLREPATQAATLQGALEEGLARAGLTAGVVTLRAILPALQPAAARQLTLFTQPDRLARARLTLERLAAKHGAAAFYRAALVDGRHPLPERRFALGEAGV